MNDPLSQYLIKQGYSLRKHFWLNTNIELGIAFEVDNALLVYRVEQDTKKVLIVEISRNNIKNNLSSPFKPIFILADATIKSLGKHYSFEGKISVFSYSRLNNEKNNQFYQHFGASICPNTGFMSLLLSKLSPQIIRKFAH